MNNYVINYLCGDTAYELYKKEDAAKVYRTISIGGVSQEELEKIVKMMNLSVLKEIMGKVRNREDLGIIMHEPIVNSFIYDDKGTFLGGYETKLNDEKIASSYFSSEHMELMKQFK